MIVFFAIVVCVAMFRMFEILVFLFAIISCLTFVFAVWFVVGIVFVVLPFLILFYCLFLFEQ